MFAPIAAAAYAEEIIKELGEPTIGTYRLWDTLFGGYVWAIKPGLVVYEDEPDTIVSVPWNPQRWQTARSHLDNLAR